MAKKAAKSAFCRGGMSSGLLRSAPEVWNQLLRRRRTILMLCTEATWGADPLEYLGGFRSLQYDPKSRYHSSLAPEGLVSWTTQQAENSSNPAVADLTVDFPHINWEYLRPIDGWASLQYQAWARGRLVITGDSSQTIVMYTDKVLEFWVDDQPYFGGDFYAFRRAPLVLHLHSGSHTIDVRLIRDIRAMGGVGDTSIHIKLNAQKSDGGLTSTGELTLPDLFEGQLASQLASIPIRNEEQEWIDVQDIKSVDKAFVLAMTRESPFRVAPGQTRPLVFQISMPRSTSFNLSLKIFYSVESSSRLLSSPVITYLFPRRTVQEPHKFTFLLPSGVLSYLMLRPPSQKVRNELSSSEALPVLLCLHGAGLDADSRGVSHMLDPVPDLRAWVLFPTGGSPWSSDDWHTWGFMDVEAGIKALLEWIKISEWKGPQVDINKWLVSGHSNGGQGTWYALTHHPDKILGGAPVSGYSSIQAYVPYTFWRTSDPRIHDLIQGSLVDYRHELFVENFAGIPIKQQHGSADDNVPVYHSRRMAQLISEANWSSKYTELPGRGHWFDTVMTTTSLCEFYDQILSRQNTAPSLPQAFTMIVANPASMTSRGGIVVDQLMSPNQLGRIQIERDDAVSRWTLRTSNILRFHFKPLSSNSLLPHSAIVDGCSVRLRQNSKLEDEWLVRSFDGAWKLSRGNWQSIEQRFGRQLGNLDSILRTRGILSIHGFNVSNSSVCLQIARNLYQYFGADAEINESAHAYLGRAGNLISVETGSTMSPSHLPSFPITVDQGKGICVRDAQGGVKLYEFEEGLGAIFVSPLPNERLELKIWGFDDDGLRHAARLLPMLTGVGQPDFVLVRKRCAWEGAAGVLGMGSFDSFWKVSGASFLL
ncbi:hypothetical protein MMC07_005275 [Pseudocyphellaria aurata]|nr:hypothetical protein [Pseudocyphellaria aurata]